MIQDYRGKAVLILGGTDGVGLAAALAFAHRGAECILLPRRDGEDSPPAREQFRADGLAEPLVLTDTRPEDALPSLRGRYPRIEALVSADTTAPIVRGLADLTEAALAGSVSSIWPFCSCLLRAGEVFGSYPRYAVCISLAAPDDYAPGHDLAAPAAAALEALCRHLTHRLRAEDVRVNVVCAPAAVTERLDAVLGPDLGRRVRRLVPAQHLVTDEDVANVVLALCSGLLDGVRGQTIRVDRGGSFTHRLSWVYDRREEVGL